MKSPTVTVTETLPVCGCIQADLQLLVILIQANDVMVRARGVQAQLPASKNKEYNDVMVHVAQFNDEMVHVRGVWRSNSPNLK